MEPSRVWKNLLSGKQAVPTVACPSCGAQVPEFRIHSHLDTCLTTFPSGIAEEEAAVGTLQVGELVHELSDGGEQTHHRKGRGVGARGQGRGRGRGRKQREATDKKGRSETGRKRSRNDTGPGDLAEVEKGIDAPAVSDDDDASVSQHWEHSVTGLDELAKSRKDVCLSDLQKQKLLSSGVVTIERQKVSAIVLQLDRLLADFQAAEETPEVSNMSFRGMSRIHNGNTLPMAALNQIGMPEHVSASAASLNTADADRQDGTQSDQGKALETWWEQWVTAEWPEGPLPSEFPTGLPERLEVKSGAAQSVYTAIEKVGTGKVAAQETTAIDVQRPAEISLNFVESGILGGKSGVAPQLYSRSNELLIESDLREAMEVVGKASSTVMTSERAHLRIPTKATELDSHSKPNLEHLTGAESSATRAGPSSPFRAPASDPADINIASAGIQACPICNTTFPPNSSNRSVNEHIDECLTQVAELLD